MGSNIIHKVNYGDIDEGQYHYGENGGTSRPPRQVLGAVWPL
jgi:hypothetical protein